MIAGVDIGGTKIAVGMVNEYGRVLAKQELPTDPEGGYAQALDRVVTMLREVSAQASRENHRHWDWFDRSGVSVHGRVRRRKFLSEVERPESCSALGADFPSASGNGE